MAIKKRPNQSQNDINPISAKRFIEAKNENTNNKIQVAVRFPTGLLSQIDQIALARGMSRNGLICYFCSKGVEDE